MANYETAFWDTEVADNEPFEKWQAAGSQDAAMRANKRWKKLLAEYQAPAIDPAVDEALVDFMDRKKAAVADAWY
jgi:trimethylamine--corrinoid protein Co-methyltransferase